MKRSNARQAHGKQIEDAVKSRFYGASDHGRKSNADEDIEAKYDWQGKNLPTHVKTTGSDNIDLSDAVKFSNIDKPFRLLVLKYIREVDYLVPTSIHHFVITPEAMKLLFGGMTIQSIEQFSNFVKELDFDPNYEEDVLAARQAAKDYKIRMGFPKNCVLKLNQKIGDTGMAGMRNGLLRRQSRVQACINLNRLLEVSSSFGIEHEEFICDKDGCLMYNGGQIGKVFAEASKQKKNNEKKRKISVPETRSVFYQAGNSQKALHENF